MKKFKERLRDPIHGLITFEGDIDEIAWNLLNTPDFQRLRRIKQLGFSELVFPGATHTRFAHSIGVYHNAKKLMQVIEPSENTNSASERAKCVLLAALLHDVGHGPFSHAFENAREAIAQDRGIHSIEKHEIFSGKIITHRKDQNGIADILSNIDENLPEQISNLLRLDDPTDIYHSIVSSSFDADRLDYLVRDRYMTGTGAGSIDEDWLIGNLKTTEIQVSQDDDEMPQSVPTFAFHQKGRNAAEDFLLARYRLFNQVYLHKTTRGFEVLLTRLIRIIGDLNIPIEELNLLENNPLVQFLRHDANVEHYLSLDDHLVWGCLSQLSRCNNDYAKELATRLINRQHLFALDLLDYVEPGDEQEFELLRAANRIDDFAGDHLNDRIFKDTPPVNLYASVSGEAEKEHKMVRVLDGNGKPQEITKFADTVISDKLTKKRRLIRYYFLTRSDRDDAIKALKGR